MRVYKPLGSKQRRGVGNRALPQGSLLTYSSMGMLALFLFMVGPSDLPVFAQGPGDRAPSATCAVSTAVQAIAPTDPNADRRPSSLWFISDDRRVWAPAPRPGALVTSVGGYWVRPQGSPLHFRLHRLDRQAPDVENNERPGYPTGSYYGNVALGEGCWQVTATAGRSRLLFTMAIRDTLDEFVRRNGSRVTVVRDIGWLDHGTASVSVSAVLVENPNSFTGLLRGARINLVDGAFSAVLFEDYVRLAGTSGYLERIVRFNDSLVYGLGGHLVSQGAGTFCHEVGRTRRHDARDNDAN